MTSQHTPPTPCTRLDAIQLEMPLTYEVWEGSLEAVTLLDNMQYILERVLEIMAQTKHKKGELRLQFKQGCVVKQADSILLEWLGH